MRGNEDDTPDVPRFDNNRRERDMHALRVELLGGRELEQILDHTPAAQRRILRTHELEAVAAIVDADAELALDLPQMLVELPAQAREPARIVGAQHDAERVLVLCAAVRQPISASQRARCDPSMNCAAAP